jgi:hypothetical protein
MSGARSVGGDAGGGMDNAAHPTPGSGTVPHRRTGPRAPGLEAGLRTPGSEAGPGAPGLQGGPAVPELERGPRTVHLVGVGGAGMSGLARLLLAAGHRVTGSDRSESATLVALRALGAEVWAGHDGARLGRPDLVVASTAIRPANPELVAARILGVPVLGRAQLLALLMAGKVGVAVAGTHGKTTTTGMVVAILEAAGLDPSFAVGGDFKASGINAAAGTGPHFVAEADESDGSFLELAPTVAVVTNVEADHLDHWGDLEAVRAAFRPTARPCSAPTTRARWSWLGPPPARWSPTGSPPGRRSGARSWPSTAVAPASPSSPGTTGWARCPWSSPGATTWPTRSGRSRPPGPPGRRSRPLRPRWPGSRARPGASTSGPRPGE